MTNPKCKSCGHPEMQETKESCKYVYNKDKKITLILENLPVYVCPNCANKYYAKKYELAKTKQIKSKLAPLIGYRKYLSQIDLKEIRNKLGKSSDDMCVLIGCRFGQYKKWEKGEEKIPACYNIMLKLLKDELDGNKRSLLDFLNWERTWWKD